MAKTALGYSHCCFRNPRRLFNFQTTHSNHSQSKPTSEIPPTNFQTLQSSYGDLSMQIVSIPQLDSRIFSLQVLTSSFGIAFIAILETLISARIADGMTHSEHNQRKEVMSIAIANILCGVMGGIPATAALARTALNIKVTICVTFIYCIDRSYVENIRDYKLFMCVTHKFGIFTFFQVYSNEYNCR
jgi:hypothetical protein